jgi:predicted dinucleotide-binding enzyme
MSAMGTDEERNPVADDGRGALEAALAEGAVVILATGLDPPHATTGKTNKLQTARSRRIVVSNRNPLAVRRAFELPARLAA